MNKLNKEIVKILEEKKAQNIKILSVKGISNFTDYMIIVTGTSSRHVRALAETVLEKSSTIGLIKPFGIEGLNESQWILLDFGDIVIHVMQAATRDFYKLEKLWSVEKANNEISINTVAVAE